MSVRLSQAESGTETVGIGAGNGSKTASRNGATKDEGGPLKPGPSACQDTPGFQSTCLRVRPDVLRLRPPPRETRRAAAAPHKASQRRRNRGEHRSSHS